MFLQISRETMLILINNLHKNVRDNCSFNLLVYSEHSNGKVFLALLSSPEIVTTRINYTRPTLLQCALYITKIIGKHIQGNIYSSNTDF